MKKRSNFDRFTGSGWPQTEELEHFFLTSKDKRWSFMDGNDNWGFSAQGLEGTGHLEEFKDRIDVHLSMWGHRDLGVLLFYHRWGGGKAGAWASKGDLSRLKEWVRTLQEDLMPIGLYIPFEQAWKAVKEFIETDGQLPKSIEWINANDLPEGTFPLPHDKVDGPVYE